MREEVGLEVVKMEECPTCETGVRAKGNIQPKTRYDKIPKEQQCGYECPRNYYCKEGLWTMLVNKETKFEAPCGKTITLKIS